MPDAPDRSAPEGAECRQHPQRRASFTCPECGQHVCLVCWQDVVDRCHACITRDPTKAVDPIPWENRGRPWPVRYAATLATAFRPRTTAPAFAYDDVPAALRFALLSTLPLSLLAGVIPHTRTLLFSGGFDASIVGQPSGPAIAWDVARAMLVQLVLTAVEVAALLLPFASLVRAYGPAGRAGAAARAVLYRSWLLPLSLLLMYFGTWALPLDIPAEGPPPPAFMVLLLARFLLPVFVLVAMLSTARLACGLGPWISMLVVLVPTLLLVNVVPLVAMAVDEYVLPPAVTIQGEAS